jgi:outer membrane protein assembly factor BamB
MKSQLHFFLAIVLLLSVSSCIRLGSPQQTTIKATSTLRLENKSSDWLFARGDKGMGVSTEKGLPDELAGTLLWTHEIQGGGVPVVAGGKVYQFGYYGSGEQVEESLTCLDLKSGELIWDQRRQDFISDIVYDRYGVGSACVDPQSGNVYFQTSAGELLAYATDGSLVVGALLNGGVLPTHFSKRPNRWSLC